MIRTLQFEVTFASTNKTFKGTHTFSKGLYNITGANEAGKSLRLEMIRYALWGSKALRADAKSYKSISVTVAFSVNEKNDSVYRVERKGNTVNLYQDQRIVAAGTKPVNEAIIKIFGYDLSVFDTTNACLQGQVEALTDKTPSERKRMVDVTIGLDAVDKVLEDVRAELRSVNQTIDLMENKVLEKFEEPILPEDLEGVDEESLKNEIAIAEQKLARKKEIETILNVLKCEEPVKPEANGIDLTLKDAYEMRLELLQAEKADIIKSNHEYSLYNNLISAFKDTRWEDVIQYVESKTDAEWKKYEDYEAKRVNEVTYTQDDLSFILDTSRLIDHYNKHKANIDCPECGHNFEVDKNSLGHFEPIDHALFEGTMAKLGIKSVKEVTAKQQELNKWLEFSKLQPVSKPTVPKSVTAAGLYASAVKFRDEFSNFNHAVAKKKSEKLASVSAELEHMKENLKLVDSFTNQLNTFNIQQQKYTDYLTKLNELSPELEALIKADAEVSSLKEKLASLTTYVKLQAWYQSKMESQKESLQVIEELRSAQVELKAVQKALNEIKPKVKTHLLPSLNSVASMLITKMTDGKRNAIKVTEDFDIFVDGQPVNTLSGSAKAVTNIAVRIALGTVLTNKVFSVFLADEIDASMDNERAAYTTECLKNLSGTIDQIILVSHKQLPINNIVGV